MTKRLYKVDKGNKSYFISANNIIQARRTADKEDENHIIYVGIAKPLDKDTAKKMEVNPKSILVIKTNWRNIPYSDKFTRGSYHKADPGYPHESLILLNKDTATKSDLRHEVAHHILNKPRSDYSKSPEELAYDELRTELLAQTKGGKILHIRHFILGTAGDIEETFNVSKERAMSAIGKGLKRIKAPTIWMNDFKEVSKK